jgi:hypothetical protein
MKLALADTKSKRRYSKVLNHRVHSKLREELLVASRNERLWKLLVENQASLKYVALGTTDDPTHVEELEKLMKDYET